MAHTDPKSTETYLTSDQVAARLQLSRGALEQHRRRGYGPRFIRIAPRVIRYKASDVEAWIAACMEVPERTEAAD